MHAEIDVVGDGFSIRVGEMTIARETHLSVAEAVQLQLNTVIAQAREKAFDEFSAVLEDLRFGSEPRSGYQYTEFHAWDDALRIAGEKIVKLKGQTNE